MSNFGGHQQAYVLSPRQQVVQYYEKIPAELHGTRPEPEFELVYRLFTIRKRPSLPHYYIVSPPGKVLAIRYLDGDFTALERILRAIDAWYAENGQAVEQENTKVYKKAYCNPDEMYTIRVSRKEASPPAKPEDRPDFLPDMIKWSEANDQTT